MMLRRAAFASLTVVAAGVLLLTACTTATPGSTPEPVDAQVHGQGTVIQVGDAAPLFCLGAVAESYPPQCSGPELVGWNWDAAEGYETAGDVTWGAYAVTGKWDGSRLTVSDAIMLALYDPMPFVDPLRDPANEGSTSADDLATVQNDIVKDAPVEILIAEVVFDDGSIQAWA
ncbi:MAG: hypothetical protein Q8M65_08305, partial [Rhodoglobus sp.]|nr:hypothetical protein [Rhodoglobus sp.]